MSDLPIVKLDVKRWVGAEEYDDKGRLKPVLAVYPWWTNSKLIAHAARLGFVGGPGEHWCDLTWGRGVWWRHHCPGVLTPFSGNFLECPFPDDTFDGTTYDPPYVSMGGRKTSGLADFMDRYGLEEAPKDPVALQELINLGVEQAVRITRPGGRVLQKSCDYISSGKLQVGTYWTRQHAYSLGLEEECHFILPGSARAQPRGRRQVHPRNNYSTLFVFRVPK